MVKYADELKQIEVETPDFLDFERPVNMAEETEDELPKIDKPVGTRKNIFESTVPPSDDPMPTAQVTTNYPLAMSKQVTDAPDDVTTGQTPSSPTQDKIKYIISYIQQQMLRHN